MDGSGSWHGDAGPQSRALRRVITLNQEIGYQVRRIMGLKDTDYTAMALLMRQPMGPTELARALHITTASATAMVDRLVRAGHVVREPHEADRRRMTVRALDGSKDQVAGHVVPMIHMVEDELATLDDAGRGAVLQFLTGTAVRMAEHLKQLRDRPVQVSTDANRSEPARTATTAATPAGASPAAQPHSETTARKA
ncbi:MarR family winged helix-turn-helix transcriptional regulator [Kocuria tytonis]|uniref:MarR family transcriptional regulator n=1 Tax=Kocuria tytonis TaxID=2054280 RepID=A0A495A4B3_9MICC|nr:MarR family transcriptional regulator [Kocuria tytonis]RKQ33137.1 MarR family transcriptional regulator [Kocuria tytonis]